MSKAKQPKAPKFRAEDVTYALEVEPEQDSPEGHFAYETEAENQAAVAAIYAAIASGNEWAWCWIRVVATWNGIEGSDSLGGCSFTDRADFEQSGYWSDMQHNALRDLESAIERHAERAADAKRAEMAKFLASSGVRVWSDRSIIELPSGKHAFLGVRKDGTVTLEHAKVAGISTGNRVQRFTSPARLLKAIRGAK